MTHSFPIEFDGGNDFGYRSTTMNPESFRKFRLLGCLCTSLVLEFSDKVPLAAPKNSRSLQPPLWKVFQIQKVFPIEFDGHNARNLHLTTIKQI